MKYDKVYFGCQFLGQTKLVKYFLKTNNFTLVGKRIKKPTSIIVNIKDKSYEYNRSSFISNVYVFWLFEGLMNNETNNIN